MSIAHFESTCLLRSDQKDRIDALVRGVQGGVFSPTSDKYLRPGSV